MFFTRSFVLVFLLLALSATPATVFAQADADQAFVSGIEDLPLMRGLTETEEGSLVFESAGGRFVEVYAIGNVVPAAVAGFYAESLPQLGWQQVEPTIYRRDNEILLIETVPGSDPDGPLTVRFALSPADS